MAVTAKKYCIPLDMGLLQILGLRIQNRSDDPAVLVNGHVWYNTSENKLKRVENGAIVPFFSAANSSMLSDHDTRLGTAEGNISDLEDEATAIASDNILSRGEKPMIRRDYDTIILEQGETDTLATLYGIGAEKTAYDNAITALTNYLTGLSPAYTDYTADTVIVGATLATLFKNVYAYKSELMCKIITNIFTSLGLIDTIADNALLLAQQASNQVLTQLNTIPVGPGDLDGAVSTVQAAVASVDDVYEIGIVSGNSGSVTFEINGESHDAVWNTSLEQTVIDFVTTYGPAGYTNIVVTRDNTTLIFTQTNGSMYTINVTQSGLVTTPAAHTSTYAAAIGQIDRVVLTGTGGMCTLNSNGATGTVTYAYAIDPLDEIPNTVIDFIANNSTEFTANGITLSADGNAVVLTAITPGVAFAPATESANIPLNTVGGMTIIGNEIYEAAEDSDEGTLLINMRGYEGGLSKFRNIHIGDGKGNTIFKIDGSSSQITMKVPDAASPGTFHTGYIYYDGGTIKMS